MQKLLDDDPWLNTDEVRAELRIGPTALAEWIKSGRYNFPRPFRLGRRLMWKRSQITEWERTRAVPLEAAE